MICGTQVAAASHRGDLFIHVPLFTLNSGKIKREHAVNITMYSEKLCSIVIDNRIAF